MAADQLLADVVDEDDGPGSEEAQPASVSGAASTTSAATESVVDRRVIA